MIVGAAAGRDIREGHVVLPLSVPTFPPSLRCKGRRSGGGIALPTHRPAGVRGGPSARAMSAVPGAYASVSVATRQFVTGTLPM